MPSALAQPALDRVLGLTDYQQPLVIRKLDSHAIGSLAQTAGVPIGFEGLVPLDRPLSIRATTRKLRDVLDAVIAADPRYEWREDDGVIVVRPVEAWNDQASALNNGVEGVKLEDVVASDLFPVLARLLGVPTTHLALGDTRRFSVETPGNSTLLHTLNAMVRAHGSLSWAFLPSSTSNTDFPTAVTLLVGGTGAGVGIPASAMTREMTCCSGLSGSPLTATAPAASESPLGPAVTGRRAIGGERSRLDRIVGTRPDGRPLVVHAIGVSVNELAAAVHLPMGLERLPPSERQGFPRPGFDGATLTGMTLQAALDMLVAIDPRYEWRDLDGVIVFRPVQAWREPLSPLYRTVREMRLEDTTMAKVLGAFTSRVGAPEHTLNSFPDTRTFTVDAPQGSVLDLLNGIARSHGELCWGWETLAAPDVKFFGGRRHMVHFGILGGGGLGMAIP